MNTLNRRLAPRSRVARTRLIPAAILAASLSGCLMAGSPGQLASSVTRPDPPPIPLRRPQPPAHLLAQAASTVARAAVAAPGILPGKLPGKLTEVVISAPRDAARITVQSLPALRKPAPASTPAAAPDKLAAPARALTAAPVEAAVYRIQAGDTVYGVARRFAVPVRGVIDANSLRPPYGLRIGQLLRVPNPRRHKVQAGDTVYGVARRYGIDPSQIVRLNRIAAPYAIAPGQSLVLPAAVPAAAILPTAVPAVASPAIAIKAAPTTGSPASRPLAKIPAPPPRAGGKFLWPVQGRTIAGYGRKKDGLHNDGINIAAPRGVPVRAADNGVVAYLGNELRGFGNLILVKHAGGWVTAYAHNQDFLVRRGQTVTRGQPIARVGSTGNVGTPQLHFEIRKGTRSVDPTRFLGPQRAAAS